jgi:hypothetical protein
VFPKTETWEPHRRKARRLIVDPQLTKWIADRASPNLAFARNERELPSRASSMTLTRPPHCPRAENTLIPLPSRQDCLNERLLPRAAQFNKLICPDDLAIDRTDTEEPSSM